MKRHFFLLSLAFSTMGLAQNSGTKDYYAMGKQAQASQNYLLAIDNFKKATTQDPDLAEAWYELGRCNNQVKKSQIAKVNFQKCIEVSTTTGRSGGVIHSRNCECGGSEYLECDVCDVFGYEQLYYPENKKVLCRTCGGTRQIPCPYGKNVSARTGSVKKYGIESYRQLADIYFDEDNYDMAVSYYDKYINAAPEGDIGSETWYNKGYCENALTHYDNAVSALNKALYLDDKDGSTYLELAYAYFKLESNTEAINNYRLAVSQDHELKYESLEGIGSVYYKNLKDYDSALIYFERALQIKKDGTLYYQLGWCYNDKERYKDAARVLKLAIQLHPDNDDALNELGYAYYKLAQYDAAIAQLSRVMKKDPENELSRYYAGLSFAKKGDQKNLKKMIEELTALNSTEYAEELKELVK
jgi:tetratricopeptide (TPR) repeat protein